MDRRDRPGPPPALAGGAKRLVIALADTMSTGPSSIRRGTDIVPYPFAVAIPGGAGAGGIRS